jgi:hypothetical protein
LARIDFEAFCDVMGKPSARHHKGWIRELVTEKSSDRLFRVSGPDTAILASRGSAKSTVLGLFVAWLIGVHALEKRMLRILYLSYSLDVARSKSHAIKKTIGSRRYAEIFPGVVLSKERTSDELWSIDATVADIEAAGDDFYSVVAQGLGGSITSRRADLICLDDVVKSSESIANPDIRAKLIANWQQVVRPCLLDGGRCVALGTRFSAVDIYGTTFNIKNGWKVMVEKAIITDDSGLEQSYWPEMWSLAYLQKLRREDPISFSYQFMNFPVSTSEIDFPKDWLVAGELTNSYDALCVGIDLSSGLKERNDWTVMTLAGIIDDRVEFIDFRRLRVMGNLEKLDELCRLLADSGLLVEGDGDQEGQWFPTAFPVLINIEAISYQQSLQADAKEILHGSRALHNLTFRAVTGYRGDKLTRLRGTFGLFQTKKVLWNRWINWEPYWAELLNFGMTDHDDCPDSMVLTLKGLLGPGKLQAAWGDWREED